MLISPDCYLEDINFEILCKRKQENYIRYAKARITHYKKIIEQIDNIENWVDPGPDVHQWWWEQVLESMTLINKLNRGEKQ